MTTILAARVADTVADGAARPPATDLLAGDPAPSRRQVAAVFRTLADHTHNEHMVDISHTDLGTVAPRLADYFTAVAEDIATGQRRTGTVVKVVDRHAADRILEAISWGRGDLDLRDEPRPTSRQVAAVLSAMADPERVFVNAALSTQVFDLGYDRESFGYRWQRTTGIGRFFHALADHLVGWPNDVLAIPTGVEAEESARRGYILVQERISAEGETEAMPDAPPW